MTLIQTQSINNASSGDILTYSFEITNDDVSLSNVVFSDILDTTLCRYSIGSFKVDGAKKFP